MTEVDVCMQMDPFLLNLYRLRYRTNQLSVIIILLCLLKSYKSALTKGELCHNDGWGRMYSAMRWCQIDLTM